MKRSPANQRTAKSAFLLLGIGLLLSFGATWAPAAEGDDPIPGFVFVPGDANNFWPFTEAGVAARRYATKGAEIVPWTKELALPSADNAALLYYQAFLLQPEPADVPTELIGDVLRGAAPDETIRVYLGRCREAIHTAELASRIPNCTWGLKRPDGGPFLSTFAFQMRRLNFALAVDARTLAADGHYRAALERCLTLRRLAHHIGGETDLVWLVSNGCHYMAGRTMQHVLGVLPPHGETLTWLRGQLATAKGTLPALGRTLQNDLELVLEAYQADTNFLDEIRQWLVETGINDEAALSLTDEEMIERAREPCTRFLNAIGRVMDSSMIYPEKYAEIDRLATELKTDFGSDPLVGLVIISAGLGQIDDLFALQVRGQCQFNALKAAIEIYLVQAETGQLPDTLPAYVPQDPFSGQDFAYEVTADGFILRSQVRDPREDKIWEYEFGVCD